MKVEIILYLIKCILCRPATKAWLENEAQKTLTPIDDMAVKALFALLCPEDEK